VGWLADSGADRKLVHHKASMAKLIASETAGRVAERPDSALHVVAAKHRAVFVGEHLGRFL